jgi:hypothetical protein
MQTRPLVTLSEIKAMLSVRETDTSKDARLRSLSLVATQQLERETGRFFTQQAHVELLTTRDNQRTDYDFRGSDYYTSFNDTGFSGMRTIVSPQSFVLDGVNVDPETVAVAYNPYARSPADFTAEHVVPAEDWQIDPETSRLHVHAATRFKVRALKVAYTAGYEEGVSSNNPEEITLSDSAPHWLKEAAILQTMFLNVKLRTDNIGMASERTTHATKGHVTQAYFMKTHGLTPEAIALVSHLKRVRTGRG